MSKADEIGRNAKCPCGSGKKYKNCCGEITQEREGGQLFDSVRIENFRCIENLKIDRLAKVNLIAAKNSVGKTALLEALFLLAGAENLALILKISDFRGIRDLKGDAISVLELLWAPLFHNLDVERKILVAGNRGRGNQHRVELSIKSASSKTFGFKDSPDEITLLRSRRLSNAVLHQVFSGGRGQKEFDMKIEKNELRIEPAPSDPPFPGYFLSARRAANQEESATLFGHLVRSKQVEQLDLVNVLKIVEPRLRELAVVPSAGASMIYGDIGLPELFPISLMGDGVSRVMDIVLRIANASGGIVLIDEIENGLHHSILEGFWRAVYTAARTFDTQVIATTHSYECIQAAHLAFSENYEYEFLLHRLDRIGDKVEVVTYDKESLDTAIQADFEVR